MAYKFSPNKHLELGIVGLLNVVANANVSFLITYPDGTTLAVCKLALKVVGALLYFDFINGILILWQAANYYLHNNLKSKWLSFHIP